jgi:1,2-diacylglycerol 3-alpha-glucosyltransferase
MSKFRHVAIYFQMFGPYIIARLNSAAKVSHVVGLEGSRRSAVYAWNPILAQQNFDRRTLFVDKSIEEAQPAEIVAAVWRVLDDTNPDVVVVSGWSQSGALAMLLWARRRKRPAILMSESTAIDAKRNWLREIIKSRIVRQFDAALVGGKPQIDYVAALGIERERIFRGYNVVDNDFFSAAAEAARQDAVRLRTDLGLPRHYFLASSRFIEKKNLSRLVKAYVGYLAQSGNKPWDLVILGDGPLRSALMEQVGEAGVAQHVLFPGFKQYEELPTYYALAGAFCHVSTVEQWGLVVNEAMASGLPVIVSRNCGCALDLVRDGSNGYVVDPYDLAQITDRLKRLASADDLEAMGQASKDIISAYHPNQFGAGLQKALLGLDKQPVQTMHWFDRKLIELLAVRKAEVGG